MQPTPIGEALTWLEKSNTDLEPELLSVAEAREGLQDYARAQRLVAFGIAALARRIDEATSVARVTGTSVTQAKDTIATSKVLEGSLALKEALKQGEISLDQASEIARAEESAPGVASELVDVAQKESFSVLRDRARKAKLEAEQHRGLSERQKDARAACAMRTSSAWFTSTWP
jgi:hypothetical protein